MVAAPQQRENLSCLEAEPKEKTYQHNRILHLHNLELMTLTEIYIYRKDRNSSEKSFLTWSEENIPPPTFLKNVKETQGERSKHFRVNSGPRFGT